MKIVLIHGQNHKGSSYHISRMLAEQFSGSEINDFFLPKDLEHFCRGCYACVTDEKIVRSTQRRKELWTRLKKLIY